MIHSKDLNNKSGFTFIEVVIAITITGLILSSLFALQSTMLNNIVRDHFKISRIFYIKNFMQDPANLKKAKESIISSKSDGKVEKEIDDPKMKLKYQLKKPNEKSTISKSFKDVPLINATGTWQGLKGQEEETFVGLIYIKPETKKENK